MTQPCSALQDSGSSRIPDLYYTFTALSPGALENLFMPIIMLVQHIQFQDTLSQYAVKGKVALCLRTYNFRYTQAQS
jgi:hypothetical protein